MFASKALALWAVCDFGTAAATFSPELGMLMAESLVRGEGGAETISYAGKRTSAGRLFLVDSNVDRAYAEPIDFANRLNVMRGFLLSYSHYGFDDDIERFNTTCIDLDDVHYGVSDKATLGMAQAGVLAAIMGMRAQICGYTSAQLITFTTNAVLAGKAELERQIIGMPITSDAIRCWLQRLDYAIRRLSDNADPLQMGFLTMDTCLPGLNTPYVVPRDPVTIAVSEPLAYFDPGLVDVNYPARGQYLTGNFSRGAWLIDPAADASYASAWLNFMRGYENSRSYWDLFSIQDRFKLTLQRNRGRDRLILSGACGGEEVSHVDFEYSPGWHFLSVAIHGKAAAIRLDDRVWQVDAPLRGSCGDTSASLGPRLDAPWDQKQAENAVIRFYDFKVSANPYTREDLTVIQNHLKDLGTDTPIVCNTRSGNERREGLKTCYPGPVVRIQYVQHTHTIESLADSVDTADEEIGFGQREYFIITGLCILSCLLIAGVLTWRSRRSFKRKYAEVTKEAEELRLKAFETINSAQQTEGGPPAQARASGGLNV